MKYSVSKAQTRTLVTCTTKAAERAIKEAARTKDEELYHQIVVMDLITTEFYKNFTKPASTSNTSNSNENVNEKASDFDKVVEFILASILNGQQAVSMKTLTESYNKEQAQDRRCHHKLKDRLIKR